MRSSPSPRVLLPLLLIALASNHRPRWAAVALSATSSSNAPKPGRYNYFAFGSNMCSATMTDLRNLRPVAATAAVLPNHELRFNVPGMPLVEPSWASVEPVQVDRRRKRSTDESGPVVHGVLYSLTEEDFEAVCRTEGVPFAYTLHRCRVVPYTGNGRDAGARALAGALEGSSTAESKRPETRPMGIPAYTLRAGNKSLRSQPRAADAPPSRSYVNVLFRGAREFGLDGHYVKRLEGIPTGRTIGGDGTAERLLDAAILRKGGGDRK